MQKANLFPKILYYICTFLLGIFLVFTMPYFFTADIVFQKTTEHLVNGEYFEAMQPMALYFNRNPVVVSRLDNGSVVVFEASTYGLDDEGREDRTKVRSFYVGFLYDAYDFKAGSTEERKSELLVADVGGNTKTVELAVYNTDSYGRLNGYAYFELDPIIQSIATLEFLDVDGNSRIKIDNVNLNFDGAFFADIAPLVEYYNSDRVEESQLKRLSDEFLSKDSNYAEFSEEEAKKIADTRSVIIIVAYFVIVYVIADFLLGGHYIIKFFRWFIYDVCKAKPKHRKVKPNEEIFGHDYYCQVTVSLDLADVPEFNESVQVKYTNTDVEIVFILLKENNYTATERVKAGIYVNPFIDMNREYAPVDLPDNLEVEGFKMDVKIKIIKREV